MADLSISMNQNDIRIGFPGAHIRSCVEDPIGKVRILDPNIYGLCRNWRDAIPLAFHLAAFSVQPWLPLLVVDQAIFSGRVLGRPVPRHQISCATVYSGAGDKRCEGWGDY
jgi:hypothetical protein